MAGDIASSGTAAGAGQRWRRSAAARRPGLLAGLTAILILVWFIAILTTPYLRFVIFTPRAKTGFDVTLSLLSFFVALVLCLFPDDADKDRLSWVALGFAILGVGGLVFGYLTPLFENNAELGRSMYSSLAVRTMAILATSIGMAPHRAPRLSQRTLVVFIASAGLVTLLASTLSADLPALVQMDNFETAAKESRATLDGLTRWHWTLSSIPLALAVGAGLGSVRHAVALAGREWLVVGMVLMAGSQLHTMYWPSAYSPVLTTASILRLAFTVVVALGAVFALRQVAIERAAVLEAERELGRRLAELARLRADFSAMVAHELASPVAALRGYSAMLATGSLNSDVQREAGAAIRSESDLISTLISDVRAAASAERDDFAMRIEPVDLGPLLAEAVSYARSLPGAHPIDASGAADEHVLADRERLSQVLRNLLGNACKHTPPGTPITVRTLRTGDRVRIEVADAGPGIHPDDMERIFEKFGRGRALEGERATGAGLGLYLSRRIVDAHGGELGVAPSENAGATFWFELRAST